MLFIGDVPENLKMKIVAIIIPYINFYRNFLS